MNRIRGFGERAWLGTELGAGRPSGRRGGRTRGFGLLVTIAWLGACTPSIPRSAASGSKVAPDARVTGSRQGTQQTPWAPNIQSHGYAQPVGVSPLPGCDTGDERLGAVAALYVEQPEWSSRELSAELERRGVPQVWPRGYVGPTEQDGTLPWDALTRWLAAASAVGQQRCGIALSDGGTHFALVSVDAAADLDRFPRRARVGQWLQVQGQLLTEADGVEVFVSADDEPPYRLSAALRSNRLRAQFVARHPGSYRIQVLARLPSGPRPVLSWQTFVDVEPPAASPAIGQSPGVRATGLEVARLNQLTNQARAERGLPTLVLVDDLERLAAQHVAAMLQHVALAHDAGDGLPTERAAAAALDATWIGENVVRARDAQRAFDELWRSPSHRANLLDPRYTRVGIAAGVDRAGTVWFCQLLAGPSGLPTRSVTGSSAAETY